MTLPNEPAEPGAEQDQPVAEQNGPAAEAGDSVVEPGDSVVEQDDSERLRRADRATRGGLAGLLCLEAFVVLLVPRALAQTSSGLSGTKTGLLLGLALILVICAFLLRRRWGIGAGSGLQLLVAATVLLIPAIAVVVVFFLLIWWYLLRTRHQLLATPAGWRMLVS